MAAKLTQWLQNRTRRMSRLTSLEPESPNPPVEAPVDHDLIQSAPPSYLQLPAVPPDDLSSPSLPDSNSGRVTPHHSPHSEPAMSRQPSSLLFGGSFFSRKKSVENMPEASTSNRELIKASPQRGPLKHHWFTSMQDKEMYDETRKRVAQAVSCSMYLAEDLTHNVLFSAVEVIKYSPIPGLEAAGRLLLDIWNVTEQIMVDRRRCLRLAMRSADFLISIREEIAQLNDIVGKQLEQPLRRFEDTLSYILQTLQRLLNHRLWERYIKRAHMWEEIENCNVALSDCLASFDRSVILRIAESAMTRRESYHQPFLIQPDERQEPLDDLDIPVVSLSPTEEPEEKLTIWRKLMEEDDKSDAIQDDRDLEALLKHAVDARDETEVIKLLQIGHSELPIALKAILKDAFETKRKQDAERTTSKDGRPTARSLSRSHTYPSGRAESQGGRGVLRQPTINSIESMLHSLDSLRREKQGFPSVVRSWTIARYFDSILINFVHYYPREDVRLGDIIGRGHFSTVYKGTWRGRTVAVKVLNPANVSKDEFNNELTIWRLLSSESSSIAKLYGSSVYEGGLPRLLISPYMVYGNLADFLKRCEWEATGNTPALFLQQGAYKVDPLRFIHDVARGMKFIHENGILHGDLRASNVLVTNHLKCVITDFGCSKFKTQTTYNDPPPTHALRWQSPELLARRSLISEQADIYAFSMTCIEISTFGNIPWPELSDDLIKEEVLTKRSRPLMPRPAIDSKVDTLIQACWHDAPASRLPFRDVVTFLQNLRYPPSQHEQELASRE